MKQFPMTTKGKEVNQSKILSLRIADIKFSIFHKANRKKLTTNLLENSSTQAQLNNDLRQKQKTLIRNSFIPSISIRSSTQVDRNKKNNNISLFPADPTYSKFPFRRPKSKVRSYFPIYRERIVTIDNKRELNLTQSSQGSEKDQRNYIVHSRAATKSCLILNQSQKEKESFVRYSNLNIKGQFSQLHSSTQRERQHPNMEKIYI